MKFGYIFATKICRIFFWSEQKIKKYLGVQGEAGAGEGRGSGRGGAGEGWGKGGGGAREGWGRGGGGAREGRGSGEINSIGSIMNGARLKNSITIRCVYVKKRNWWGVGLYNDNTSSMFNTW